MSRLVVEILKIENVMPHPDPETTSLEILVVKGWQSVVKKDAFKTGDLCVYFPLDAILPSWLSDKMNVTKFLSKGRVKAVRLRGEPSYGIPYPVANIKKFFEEEFFAERKVYRFAENDDVGEILGITKWEPPLKLNAADQETPHEKFRIYDGPENIRNFPNVLIVGEDVVMSEKIHGQNCRHGLIEGTYMAGTHTVRCRENPQAKAWYVFKQNMKDMLAEISSKNENADVIMYGEIFGSGVQDLVYGLDKGQIGYRCFDIMINGKYMGFDEMNDACLLHGIMVVPYMYKGPFSMEQVMKFSTSKSMISGADNIMEGAVIKPLVERRDHKIGRVIMKYVFDQYLTRKGGTEFH